MAVYQAIFQISGYRMDRPSDRKRPGLGYHVKVHTFRILTVVLAWVLIVAAFYQRPEFLTGVQRFLQRGIEALGDTVPPPWGPRIEFIVRQIGGVIWLQITLIVVALRLALSMVVAIWRLVAGRDRRLWNQSRRRVASHDQTKHFPPSGT
jgi:hypothetical protein